MIMEMKRKILVVSNQIENQEILRDILENVYTLWFAKDGQTALDVLQKDFDRISAVLLDLALPDMSGYEWMGVMQKTPGVSDLPVLAFAPAAETECELKALNLGAGDFIYEPFDGEILKKRLHNLIKKNETVIGIMERDTLTGLYSKEGFCHRIEEVLRQRQETVYQIIALDIEHFKLFNDTYGVEEGDKLLKYLAHKILEKMTGCRAVCARVYADQFLIFGQGKESHITALTDALNQDMECYPLDMKVHVKTGVYEVRDTSISVNSMCDRAFIAVKAAKGRYEQDVAYYDDSIREKLLLEQQIGDEMVQALRQEQFEVYFQPKYNLTTGDMVGAEALVRWQHPEKGFMSPADFIPIFEKNGFITELDMYVWEKCCRFIADWKEKYHTALPISVNVSRKDIYKQNLPEILKNLVNRYGVSPKLLHLEITETVYTENPEQLLIVVEQLKKDGFIIEMDDFGSGYSSLNMLAELPIDVLKLDMKFLQNKGEQRKNENIMSSIVELAKKINLYVIAEGVELERQIEMLKAMKCDMVQGYYYAKPMPAVLFERTCLA